MIPQGILFPVFLGVFYWDVSPEITRAGPFTLRWYGLLFALSFLFGILIVLDAYHGEGKAERDVDRLFLLALAGTVIGARLGHCLFYEPAYYLGHPLEIPLIWKGGLASHGGAAGILLALFLHSRSRPGRSFPWLLDRISIPAALGGCLIRLGNLFNSEIIGKPTAAAWGFVFARVDRFTARHPSQLYESLAYGLLFLLLLVLYRKNRRSPPEGLLAGLFLAGAFTARFLIEFTKERQASYGRELPLSVGQLLSIPFIAAGILLLARCAMARKGPS